MASTMRFDRWEDTLGNSVNMTQVSGGSGLVPVIPSSVTLGSGTSSVATNGLVTFTGATSISLNGVFTSAYKGYRIIISGGFMGSTSGTLLSLRYRNAGTDRTDAVYTQQGVVQNGTGLSASYNSGIQQYYLNNLWDVPRNMNTLEINNPYDSAISITHSNIGFGVSGNYQYLSSVGTYSTANSNDGFTIFPAAGNITGTIQVYGYR